MHIFSSNISYIHIRFIQFNSIQFHSVSNISWDLSTFSTHADIVMVCLEFLFKKVLQFYYGISSTFIQFILGYNGYVTSTYNLKIIIEHLLIIFYIGTYQTTIFVNFL